MILLFVLWFSLSNNCIDSDICIDSTFNKNRDTIIVDSINQMSSMDILRLKLKRLEHKINKSEPKK